MGSSIITPEDVLESLMNDGTIDALRLKIINQLKANVFSLEGCCIWLMLPPLYVKELSTSSTRSWSNRAGSLEVEEGVSSCSWHCVSKELVRLPCLNFQVTWNLEELKKTTITMVEQSKVLNTPGAEKQTKRELFDALRQELEAPVLEKASKSVWELILDNNGLGKEVSETVERVFCRLSGQEPPLYPTTSGTQHDKEDVNENPSSSKKRAYTEMNGEVDNKKTSGDLPAVSEDSNPPAATHGKT